MPSFNQKATAYIAAQPSPQKEICEALRNLILENLPLMTEEYKWNYPAYYFNGKRVCLASAFKAHVTVELFYGARLHDTQGRIVGKGKNTRHIKLRSVEEIDIRYFVDLLKQSIALLQAETST